MQTIRWAAIVLVIIAVPLGSIAGMIMFILAACATGVNSLSYSSRFALSNFNALIADYIFAIGVIAGTGGLSSPFYALFFLLLIRTVALYGIAGFAFALSAQIPLTVTLNFFHFAPTVPAPWLQIAINLSLVVIVGLAAEQNVRRQSEEYLLGNSLTKGVKNERERLLALINSLSHAVIALNEAGKVYLYNAAALELLNTNQDIHGQALTKLLPLHDNHGHQIDLIAQLTRTDRPVSRQDLHFKATDGSTMALELTATPVHAFGYGEDHNGGYIVVFRDITKQKSLDEQRDEFISVTSHELRTPLAIAEANLSTALMPGYAKIEPKAKKLLTQTYDNLTFLSALIEDLTSLSRAERKDLNLTPELVNVSQLISDLVRDYAPQAQAKHLKLTADVGGFSGNIVTSPAELREILQNLLINAIKYTQHGSVTMKVIADAKGTEFTIEDTGIGISVSDKRKIFTKFYRSEDYRTRQTGGTGLGLYITEKLAEKLGAQISFTSRLNHGSSFRVLIPSLSE